MPHFSAFVVLRGERILYERYAPDFGPDRPHPIMSITKTTLNLMLGRCVADGLINLDERVGTYLPEIGTGYAEATVKAVADMNVANDFSEDYTNPNATWFAMEAAVGWRLPLAGHMEETTRSFVCGITGGDLANRTGYALYKSTNSDVLGWIIERASGRPLRDWLIEIVEAAGLEDASISPATARACRWSTAAPASLPATSHATACSSRARARASMAAASAMPPSSNKRATTPAFQCRNHATGCAIAAR